MADLNSINFTNQFFKLEHYDAFSGNKPSDDLADVERREVADKLIELDSLLYPEILKHGWHIHRHPQRKNRTSTWELSQSREDGLRAVWFHYGKSEIELEPYMEFRSETNPQTFINHIRLQLVVRNDNFEIALMLGKEHGGKWDRDNYHNLMQNETTRVKIFQLLSKLDSSYWQDFKSNKGIPLNTFSNGNDLWNYTRIDNPNDYFTFGKSISPDDVSISINNIKDTVINEFKKLYPLYNLIKHRF